MTTDAPNNAIAGDLATAAVGHSPIDVRRFSTGAHHYDTTTKNVIVTPGGSFSGIVDVDDLCFGDPRYVVALTLASLTAFGGPTHYIDAWMNAANYNKDRIFQLYVALFLVDFMSEHGQEFNGNVLRSSADCRKRLLAVFAESLRCID